MSNTSQTESPPSPPSQSNQGGVQPTGNITHDVLQSVKHLEKVPCARNSLLTGIATGAGMAFIRGISVSPMVAGHWFAATFVIVSAGSWHLCQRQIDQERAKVQQIIESAPKRTLKTNDSAESSNTQ